MHAAATAVALALLAAAPLLSGCATPPVDDALAAAALVPVAGALNQQATVEPETRQANELSIAVNPMDPLNIIATGKDYTPSAAGQCVWDGIYVTKDGGATWHNSNLVGSPWKAREDVAAGRAPTLHETLSKFYCATDPVVAFGPDGTAYWTVMPYQCDPASGSPTGRGQFEDGGFNDWMWTCSSMYVLASDDGGATWARIVEVDFGPRLEHDKQWLSVAPDGTVLLCWDRDPSYQATSALPAEVSDLLPPGLNPNQANAAEQLRPNGFITCATSTDKGATWSQPADANRDASDPAGFATSWTGFLPWVDWDASNNAWMAALNGTHVIVSRSADGLAWETPVGVGTYLDPPAGGEYGWPVLRGSDFRMFAVPSLAVDRSGGPYDGSIYVAWFDHSANLTDGSGTHGRILLTYSRDGATWSTPMHVRDASPNAEHDQFMPAVSVGPDGTVDLVWLDRRLDAANHLYDAFYAYSVDGGATWSPDLRVSTQSSDEQYSHHQNGMVFLGDYIDIDSSPGHAHPVWVDTRNGKADVFVATIARPGANADR